MSKIKVNCDNCGKEFEIERKIYNAGERKGHHHHYCSKLCESQSRKTGIIVRCNTCGKEFYITKRKAEKSEVHYCSLKCAHLSISHSHSHSEETKDKIRNNVIKWFKTSKQFADYQNTLAKKRIEKTCPVCGKSFVVRQSESSRIYCSKKCYFSDAKCQFRKSSPGGKRHSSGRGKKGWYKGYFCDSSWELAYVIYNLEHNIHFIRNLQGFEYEFKGKIHKYYPDFILDDGSYVEIKGLMTDKNKTKINSFKKPLHIITSKEIKPYLEYVEHKYGNDFIKLYEGNPYNKKNNTCKICGAPCKNIYCSRKCSMIGCKIKKNS